jgi:hypothetical protein
MGFPSTPSNGQTAVVNGITYTYNNARTAWVRTSANDRALFTASNIAPTSPALGDKWYYIAGEVVYEYINDGTTNYWVDTSGAVYSSNVNTLTTFVGETIIAGNIIPSNNNAYSLGNVTHRFINQYISANITAGNILTDNQYISGKTISGNILTTSGVFWANGTSFSSPPGGVTGQIQFNNANAFSGANVLFSSTTGNVVVTSVTTSISSTTGALTVGGGIGIAGNIYSDAVYTTTGVYWANNNAAFSSAPGGTTGMLQYNSSSTFAGAANVSYDSTSGNLLIITPTNGTATGGALTVRGGASFVGNIFVTGNILATNQIIAAYSDERLKNKLGAILNPIHKVKQIETFYYTPNDLALSIGVNDTRIQVGVSAQSVEKVLPEVVTSSPINSEYKTVSYERIVPLLIAAIIEQQSQIDQLKETVNVLQNR